MDPRLLIGADVKETLLIIMGHGVLGIITHIYWAYTLPRLYPIRLRTAGYIRQVVFSPRARWDLVPLILLLDRSRLILVSYSFLIENLGSQLGALRRLQEVMEIGLSFRRKRN
jgi:hypothetical protein